MGSFSIAPRRLASATNRWRERAGEDGNDQESAFWSPSKPGRRDSTRPKCLASTRHDGQWPSCRVLASHLGRVESRRARLSRVSNAHSDPRLARAGPDTFISAPRGAAGQSPRGAPWRSVLRTEEKESYMYHESVGYKRTYITNKKSGSAFFTIDFVKVTKRRLCNLA